MIVGLQCVSDVMWTKSEDIDKIWNISNMKKSFFKSIMTDQKSLSTRKKRGTSEYKQYQREYNQQYYNRPEVREHRREYYQNHTDHIKEYSQRPDVMEH